MQLDMKKFPQQGWQCPTCERIYAPQTHMCFYCPQKTETFSSINTTANTSTKSYPTLGGSQEGK